MSERLGLFSSWCVNLQSVIIIIVVVVVVVVVVVAVVVVFVVVVVVVVGTDELTPTVDNASTTFFFSF